MLALTAGAQEDPPPGAEPPLTFEPVVVTATRLPAPLAQVGASVSVVEGIDVQGAQRSVGLEESLDRVPGVLVQSSENFAQDARIQIRGFGTRAAFGIREIRVLVDGLPETQPDGQTQIDDIDLGAIGRIEVLRGPAGALYGNASGGVIQLFTEDAPEVPTATVQLSGGSYGFGKYQLKGGGRAGAAQLFVHGSYLQLDGYRDHSATRAGTITGKFRYTIGDATDVTVLLNLLDTPVADDPGALTRQQACDDPRAANPLNVLLDAGESVRQVRAGTVLDHHTEFSDLSAYVYGLYRDFENLLPILPRLGDGIVTFDRTGAGGGGRWSFFRPLFGFQQTFTAGIDVQYQDDNRRRLANVLGERGALGLHQTEQVGSVGPYLRQAVNLRDDLELSAGLRYDWVDFDVDVAFPPDSGDSGSRSFERLSPTGGVRWTPWQRDRSDGLPELNLFASIGTAFQTPTTTELVNPNGPGFNPAIEPQTSITYEIGGRTQWIDRVQAGLAGYLIDIDDELIPFESLSGRTAFRNAARARRLGLELDWQATPAIAVFDTGSPYGWLRWSGALTAIDAEYTSYEIEPSPGVRVDFDGNDEPGIPQWWLYQELRHQHPIGIFAALELFAVDGYFVDDANTASTSTYALLNLRAGYEHTWGAWTVAPFVGLNNLTDTDYEGTARLNALGGRYFEPAPGFNVYGGIAVTARL